MTASLTDVALVASMAAKAIARAKSAQDRAMTPGPRGLAGDRGEDGRDGKDGASGLAGRDGVDGKNGANGDTGPAGSDGKQGEPGKPGPAGKDGKDGTAGKDGEPGKPGVNGTAGKQGEKGDKGDTPDHEWIGTGLRFEKPDGTWGETVDLRGPKGSRGDKGASGGGGGGGGTSAPGFDPSGLPLASAQLPSEFVVQQGGQWVRASYEQMRSWFPYGALPEGTTTVNGEPVTVNGGFVTVTGN